MVLYNKYRPIVFAELFGQERIAETLINALSYKRVAHAYLFTGTRGTGKTTAGRLLAKALNCKQRIGGEPCNVCRSCRRYRAGRASDLIEIDAASNRGIDDIRALRDKAPLASVGAYKVYLVDEVHMLTEQAFNALLKLLEEPPAHVVFVLATTEVTKIPSTIMSRCQRFDFKRASIDSLTANLTRICVQEEIDCEPEVLELIAKSATGSHRDAVGLLDLLVTSYGHKATLEQMRAVLGLIDDARASQLIEALRKRDLLAGLNVLAAVRDDGLSLRQFQRQLVIQLRGEFERRPHDALIRKALRLFAEAVVQDSTIPLDIALSECCLEDTMAKPYRTKPLIGADDGVGLPILKTREERMTVMLSELVPQFNDEFIMHVATEIGLDEAVTFNEQREGALDFDLTALQIVALTAALAACKELRDERRAAKKAKSR